VAVWRNGSAVEAHAGVAYKNHDALLSAFCVDEDLIGARELCGVRHRLARGEYDLTDGVIERRIASVRNLDSDAMQFLDIGGGIGQGVHQQCNLCDAASVEPAAKLALLASCEGGDPLRVTRMTLDERQCLQDGVVNTRRDLGTLLDTDPFGPLAR
jgi:hypothetical protein